MWVQSHGGFAGNEQDNALAGWVADQPCAGTCAFPAADALEMAYLAIHSICQCWWLATTTNILCHIKDTITT